MSDEEPRDDDTGDDTREIFKNYGKEFVKNMVREESELPPELPEGILKQIIEDGKDSKMPRSGDQVTIHVTGRYNPDERRTNELFSSLDDDKPWSFVLGRGKVIKGLELAVPTMRRAERAEFTFAPHYAYGATGHPDWDLPPHATVKFEVELINWISKHDLFQDEGVMLSELKAGIGWRSPVGGDVVLISMKCTAKDGTIVEENDLLEYVIGAGVCGSLSKTIDKALTKMTEDEEVELACTSEYALGDKTPEGATVSLKLCKIFETKDISVAKDKTLMKTVLIDGEGDAPKDNFKLKLHVEEKTAGSLPGFTGKTLEFRAGNGEVCDALELAVMSMKKGEMASLTCTAPAIICEDQLGLASTSAEVVALTIGLLDLEKDEDTSHMTEDERIEFGTARKEVGSNLFRQGRYFLALGKYKRVCELFDNIDSYEEANKAKAKDLKKTCELNSAGCQLKLKDYNEAIKSCDIVLKEDSLNVKALFRRAQANFNLKKFMDSMADSKTVLEVDPKNKEARALYYQAKAGQKVEDEPWTGFYKKMCKFMGEDDPKDKMPEMPQIPTGENQQDETLNESVSVWNPSSTLEYVPDPDSVVEPLDADMKPVVDKKEAAAAAA